MFELSELWAHKHLGSKERILSGLILDLSQTTNGLGICPLLWEKLLSPAPASISTAIRFFMVANALACREKGHAYLPSDVELETGELVDNHGEEFAARQPGEHQDNEGPVAVRSTDHPILTQDLFGPFDDASGSRTGDICANPSAEQSPLQSSPLTQAGSSPLPEIHGQAEPVIPNPPPSTEKPMPCGTKRKRGTVPAPGSSTRRRVATVPAPDRRTRSQAKPQ